MTFFTYDNVLSLITLTVLEIILGIDNLVFISILSNRLPKERQAAARRLGLILALVTRLLLLAMASWISNLVHPLFSVFNQDFSARDLLLLGGGLFLLAKATTEIHQDVEDGEASTFKPKYVSVVAVAIQISLLDIVFSLDSVITAVGMTNHFGIMATAILIAIMLMLFASEPLSRFIHQHPTVKMLALSFLLLVGLVLIADGLHFHVPRGYLYFAMAFSLFVEGMNMLVRKRKVKRKQRMLLN